MTRENTYNAMNKKTLEISKKNPRTKSFNKFVGILKLSGLIVLMGLMVASCQQSGTAASSNSDSTGSNVATGDMNSVVWPAKKANEWYAKQGWLTGADYIPSNAINQLEMWQKETFSPELIDKEFQLAESIGFNTMRVFLHSLVWKEDAEGFKKRIDEFLSIAEKHHIKPMFVFFDDCWNKEAHPGKQPEPKVGVHNSGWVQDPGQPASEDTTNFPELEKYVTDILNTFKHDQRILAWDLYNEPGNSGKKNKSLPLLKAVFSWAQTVRPDQPITAGLWDWGFEDLNKFQITNSDIITYHDYEKPEWHKRVVQLLKTFGKPLICTEYMARTRGSLFSNTLPMLKDENVGAINWGFVEGKTNTKYAWDSPMPDGGDPTVWFHEIFRKNFTPYKQDEVELIKKLNGKSN
ncbi:hypothetical protein SAMN05192529_11544 [Arachidicoccus rhizosphaerae]|uniref:Cellulase (Glycosyl hydrolase family 5) n=1 Tax=Arachidicoccus rhizosphaerae TaxID=551991 RepID=A0A1H4AKL2_9BACT|nr:1,4-beta-xylanase [Arachidicoccus rhizosphaerae]SEA36455.1 hypothetical protein SAMN05192529_11544 [Arachidicoccus rhizosphaerae]